VRYCTCCSARTASQSEPECVNNSCCVTKKQRKLFSKDATPEPKEIEVNRSDKQEAKIEECTASSSSDHVSKKQKQGSGNIVKKPAKHRGKGKVMPKYKHQSLSKHLLNVEMTVLVEVEMTVLIMSIIID